MHPLDDDIAAIATAPGAAGLAVVRVSGRGAIALADAVFRGRRPLGAAGSHTLHHGRAVWPETPGAAAPMPRPAPGTPLDEVVAAVFRAPRSYTRQDVVEFSCHGGRLPADRVLSALLAAGARLAAPGEFTLRAFLGGRLDLAQAEAVADLIHAETDAARSLALAQLGGALSSRIEALAERIADAAAEVEARVDFAEDVGGIEVPVSVTAAIAGADADLAALLEGAAYARAVREGVRVPLIGRPNVGKSSLFNALVGEERAIVTPEPGTTRDRVSEAVEIAGVRVTLSDTAGLREASGPIEAIGIARAREALDHGVAVLWVVDRSEPLAVEDRAIAARLAGKPAIVALNKSDLGAAIAAGEIDALFDGAPHRVVAVSATGGAGLPALRAALAELVGADGAPGLAGAVGNPRHADALGRARTALARALAAARVSAPGEIVALELREALGAVGEVTGRAVGEDLLERIFSRFCVGK
ncbi:MAG: tRNA uridine-5-carboxymethylaminomethyl(34) synthesis GTPase MnmE [Candidatus Eisenbacteria bacterium RBG_16_71_46]|nr:MAG: tRNA uridine-5-carboxymethylaminomethyl(34) synthesis GTPase MnmE [Candidatus Eisenbacteria bacterium RBG_16_71_46]